MTPDLPEPAPEIIMAATGVYWRRYPEALSMVPVSDDDDPVLTPFTIYRPLAWEDHDGQRHLRPEVVEQIARVVDAAESAPGLTSPRVIALAAIRAVLGGQDG